MPGYSPLVFDVYVDTTFPGFDLMLTSAFLVFPQRNTFIEFEPQCIHQFLHCRVVFRWWASTSFGFRSSGDIGGTLFSGMMSHQSNSAAKLLIVNVLFSAFGVHVHCACSCVTPKCHSYISWTVQAICKSICTACIVATNAMCQLPVAHFSLIPWFSPTNRRPTQTCHPRSELPYLEVGLWESTLLLMLPVAILSCPIVVHVNQAKDCLVHLQWCSALLQDKFSKDIWKVNQLGEEIVLLMLKVGCYHTLYSHHGFVETDCLVNFKWHLHFFPCPRIIRWHDHWIWVAELCTPISSQ